MDKEDILQEQNLNSHPELVYPELNRRVSGSHEIPNPFDNIQGNQVRNDNNKFHFKKLYLLIALIVLLAILTLTYILISPFTQKPKSQQISIQPSPTINPTQIPIDETANWKTYRNEKYGFSFKYPSDLDIKSDSSTITLSVKNSKNNPLITLITFENPNNLSLKDFEGKNKGESGIGPNVYDKDAETIKISNGMDVYHLKKEISCFEKCESYVWLDEKNIYKFINWQNSKLATQILSTFKFLGQQKNTPDIKDLEIIDGSVYQGQKLLISKKNCATNNNINQYFNYESFIFSPDKSKILLFGDATLSVSILCYTSLNPVNVRYIGFGIEARWSHDSRYIAYNSKPADAGGTTIIGVYDTQLNKDMSLAKELSVPNLTTTTNVFLEYSDLLWQNDSSGISVHYLARSGEPYGDNLGEGNIVIPLTSFTFDQ